jgi:CubicO group peptidase (beta-lactamase class C family)
VKAGKAMGLAVGVTGPGGRRFVAAGRRSASDPRPPAIDSEIQIASITKLFTALILMDMVRRGEARLDQPLAELLPRSVKVPTRNGRQITLVDLATHTSGLPREADFDEEIEDDPWNGFTEAELYKAVAAEPPDHDIGTGYVYSNFGYCLLADALARRAGEPWPTLAERRVLRPLGLADTRVHLDPGQARRMLPGHGKDLKPMKRWRMDQAAVGIGGLNSTAADLMSFLEAAMGLRSTPLAPAFQAMLSVKRPKPPQPGEFRVREVAIGWHIQHSRGGDALWHDGGTGGYSTFAGYNPALKTGVVILSNSWASGDLHDLGYWLLCGDALA